MIYVLRDKGKTLGIAEAKGKEPLLAGEAYGSDPIDDF
jgi:hypothetical protein